MSTIDPKSIATRDLHQILVSTVAPRPIALVSTMSNEGVPNLAPYSFFNVFSSNPPTLIFSSNLRIKDDTSKDTLHNVQRNREVVINAVTRKIARQVALASVEYAADVNEFEKAGLTPLPSEEVSPLRVAESPAQFECRVKKIMPLGDAGGAGNLVICEVLMLHLHDDIYDEKGKIDPLRLDLVGRMGRTYYCHAGEESIFSIYQPFDQLGIGFDQLPRPIRESRVFSGHDLASLAAQTVIPDREEAKKALNLPELKALIEAKKVSEEALHELAKRLLNEKRNREAFAVAMLYIYELI